MEFRNFLNFSQSWEDHLIIERALQIEKDDTIVCILGSGDNVFNLLRFEPYIIYSFDINPMQVYEVKLKIIGIENLDYSEFLILIGYTGDEKNRINVFKKISSNLDSETLNFWKNNFKIIKKGLAFQGILEKQFSMFRKRMKFLLGKEYNRFINSGDKTERKEIFEKRINRSSIRFLHGLYHNKTVTNFFNHKDKLVKNLPSNLDYNKIYWERMHHLFVDIGCKNNPYLYWVFTGKILGNQQLWQPYLQEKNYYDIRRNLDKIKVYGKDLYNGIKEFDENSIDAFYLSDIFDWMDIDEIEVNMLEVIRRAKPKAKILSFVLSYDKGIPKSLEKYLEYNENINKNLLIQDRVGFYSKIYLWKVTK